MPWKLWVRKLNFHWKVCGNFFFKAPLTRVNNFKPKPPFCTKPLLTSVCERSLLSTRQNEQPKYFPNQNHSAVGFSILFRSRRTYVFVCHGCLFTFYFDQLFPVLSFTFACFCEILYVAYSAVDVCFCLVSYIVCIFGNQIGIFVHTPSLLSREIVRKSSMSCLHFRIILRKFHAFLWT